jgi:hypothetical protein
MPAVSRTDGLADLSFLRQRAKHLLKALRQGHAPEQRAQLLGLGRPGPNFQLADSQWLVAREAGFASWPKLKAHVDAIAFAARHPGFSAAHEAHVQHWRCGNDIEHSLRTAGFKGAFHMLADPLTMGPVRDVPLADYMALRGPFLTKAFNLAPADSHGRLATEYGALNAIDAQHEIVLWCEADAYDQLFLIRLLAGLRELPRRLELIEVARVPGVARFIGIGQLAPDVLAWLWPQRRPLAEEAQVVACEAWRAYTSSDPRRWAQLAQQHHSALPLLAPALARQLQELPGVGDGLSLTERMTLRILAEQGEQTAGRVFAHLMAVADPLPYLGDLMFHALIRPLIEASHALLIEGEGANWAHRSLRLSALGERVMAGQAHWLDQSPAERWVGGIRLAAGEPVWMVDERGQVQRR